MLAQNHSIPDTHIESRFDDLARLAAHVCGAPIAAVSFVDEEHQGFIDASGLGSIKSSPYSAFFAHTILHRDGLVVQDAAEDPRFAGNCSVTGEPRIRFYAGAPLIASAGPIVGALCVVDRKPREITAEQLAMLKTVARQIVERMELQQSISLQDEMLVEQMRLRTDFEQILAERELAGAALRESQARLQSAFENAAVGAAITDLKGRFLFVNTALCTLTGYSEKEMLALDIAAITHPDDMAHSLELNKKICVGHVQSIKLEKRYIRKDGSVVWVKISVSLGRDAQGNPEHTLMLGEDITASKLAEFTKEESRKHSRQLLAVGEALGAALTKAEVAKVILEAAQPIFDASMVRACLLDSGSNTLRTLHLVGSPSGLSPSWQDISIDTDVPLAIAVRERRLVIDTIDRAATLDPSAAKSAKNHPTNARAAIPLMIAERCIGGLGMICPAERCAGEQQQAFLWTLAGQCALALERARLYDEAQHELAEKQKAEIQNAELAEYNRLLLESAAHGIYGIDTAGRCTFINKAATLLLGCTPGDVLGKNMHDLIHHTDGSGNPYPVEQCPIVDSIRLSKGCQVEDGLLWRLDGSCFPAAYSSLPMRTASGTVGAVVTFSDITERKQAEDARERALIEAQERADRDSLTGLLNHRAFHKRLEQEAGRALRESSSVAVVMLDMDNFKFFNDAYGHILGDKILYQVADRLRSICRSYDTVARFGGDEFALLLPFGSKDVNRSELEARLWVDMKGLTCSPDDSGGSSIPINISTGVAVFPGEAAERGAALELADERLRRAKTGGAVDTEADVIRRIAGGAVEGFSMLDALVTSVDNKDRYTRKHSEDVARYSVMIARELNWSHEEIETVAVAALLHDVGKIGVPDAVLRKPGKLTDAEYSAIQQHPMMGAALVSTAMGLEKTLDAVRHHHERWDGGGYPYGLSGEETPLMARLMAVADAFSAMTTDRPYRKGMPWEKALAILQEGAGTQWDKQCVEAFLQAQSARLDAGDLERQVSACEVQKAA